MTERPRGCGDGDLLRGDLGDAATQFAIAGFAALWRGRSVPALELLPANAAEVVASQSANGRLEVDDDGNLVGVHGLTLRATRHRFDHAGHRHNTWCAFDSIGIPAALALDAVAHTDCPTCGRPIAIDITGGEPQAGETLLWLPTAPNTHLMDEFCASADLYCSPDHLRQRIDVDRAEGSATSLRDAAALGREVWADVAALDLDVDG